MLNHTLKYGCQTARMLLEHAWKRKQMEDNAASFYKDSGLLGLEPDGGVLHMCEALGSTSKQKAESELPAHTPIT